MNCKTSSLPKQNIQNKINFVRSSTHKRRSHSMGTSHFGGEKLVTQTTVTVGRDGSAHAESFIETVPVNTVTIWEYDIVQIQNPDFIWSKIGRFANGSAFRYQAKMSTF